MSILGVILFSIVGIFMITIGITDERLTLLFVPGGILVLLISLPLLPTALSAKTRAHEFRNNMTSK
jgi:hypothetical protein